LIKFDYNEKNFIKHNKALFNNSQNKNNQILIEITNMQPNHIAISHFSNVLSEIHDAQLVGYEPRLILSLFDKVKTFIRFYKFNKIYQSFGVNKFLSFSIKNKTLANQLAKKLMSEIKSKSDLENLTIDDVWVGDLIYDQYLKLYKVPTVNIESDELKKLILEFCILFCQWKDFLSKKTTKAIVLSHACYFMGIPGRIAIDLGILVYQTNLLNIYYLSKKNLFPSSEFHSYMRDFEKLDFQKKKNSILEARERLKIIFQGSTDVDQEYIKISAYHQKKTHTKLLRNKNPIKILIAPHSFYDSPHGIGKNLFPDFYEWLEFVGELSNYTEYEWYIKTHIGMGERDKNTIDDFVLRYDKIILIPVDTSHHQLIVEGINIVLTIYGSIGLEYAAAKNITVINASLNNPHISYDFNIHPKTIDELKNIILNLDKYVNNKVNSDDVYKCYYMKYLDNKHDIFHSNFQSLIKKMGGYESLFSSKFYENWINYYTPDIHSKIDKNLKKFVLSKEYKIKSNWS